MIIAAVAVPRVSAGSAMMRRFAAGSLKNGTHWSEGIHPRYTEKSRISTVPCQNAGSERPSVASTRMAPSRGPPGRVADRTPRGMPRQSDQPTARTASSADTGTRSRNSPSTGRPDSHDVPEIAPRHPAEPVEVLDVERAVEPEEPAEALEDLGRRDRRLAEELLDDRARDEPDHAEDQHAHPQEGERPWRRSG